MKSRLIWSITKKATVGKMATSTFYVQFVPIFHTWGIKAGEVKGFNPVRLTKSLPSKPASKSVVVKLTVEISDDVFKPLIPTATISVPSSHPLVVGESEEVSID